MERTSKHAARYQGVDGLSAPSLPAHNSQSRRSTCCLMNSPFVARLRDDLGARLVLLEREAKIIRRALRVLDERPASCTKHSLVEDVLAELQASPGSRASLIALALRR